MAYTRPDFDAADATFLGAAAYTRPDFDAADASFLSYPQGLVAAPSMLGAPAVLGASVAGWAAAESPLGSPAILGQNSLIAVVEAPSMLGAAQLVGAHVTGWASAASPLGAPSVYGALAAAWAAAPSMLGAPALLGSIPLPVWASAPSMLGAPAVLAYHDFTPGLGDATTLFVMDLITETGAVRVPISSWQATLQTGSANYVQCVIPACAAWVSTINAATEFVIYRQTLLPDGRTLEYEMARAPADQAQFDRGSQRYTCTLSGYSPAFAEDLDPPAVFDRDLAGVRTISSGSALRVRCAVDWLLRPGHRAYADGSPFVVGYINYYAPSGWDSYMDVGEQS